MRLPIILILAFFFINPKFGFSQGELPVKNGKVYYELIDSSVSATASDLHTRGRIWFADAFRDSKEVIQLDDRNNNTLIGKGTFSFTQGLPSYTIRFTARIDTKDNKYRAQFYDIIVEFGKDHHESTAEKWNEMKGYKKVRVRINERFAELIANLKQAMSKTQSPDF